MSDTPVNPVDPLDIFREAVDAVTNSAASGSTADIYQYISDGKTIEMHFLTKLEAQTFYGNLSKYRTKTEDNQVNIGFISEAERSRVCFRWNSETHMASFFAAPKLAARTFQFVVKDKEK